ncbi:MAG: efflux RND transporter periplasmic adaptor subunit [Candidatus Eisenbacteria bacterium]|uniref:Efflux RND transporter periplasmic adaptor subunit n=1 Tax=Eiseniibacteriota bacterium TaxID=2212470 RepID=A0A948RVB3_UNCEI|nr:efflux RND transporter periplasmic adaptor subunit [Candidatus Eisenbacteria bacterium]
MLKPRVVVVLCLFLGLCLMTPSFMGCGGDKTSETNGTDSTQASSEAEADTTGDSESLQKKEKEITVDAGEVRRAEMVIPIYADGVIRTPRFVEIRTKVGGELIKMLVQDGDRVRAGQLIGKIDQREYSINLDESRYSRFKALSSIAAESDTFTVNKQALQEFIRAREELDNQFNNKQISQEEYRVRRFELEVEALQKGAFRQEVFEQRTGLAEARLAEERATLNLENTEIRAPFDGVVQGLSVVLGEIVSAGTPICTIYNNDRLEAVANVLEADLGNLVEGRPALLVIPATGDTLQTRIAVISPNLDEASRTCEVIIRFDNIGGRLRPGMFVRAQIAGWIHPDKLMVPKEAILLRDNRPLVFKVMEDRAQWLYVDTGLENDSWVEILKVHSGGSLAPGDRVVVSDHLTLAHEARIKIRKTRPPKDRWDFAIGMTEQPSK